MVLRKKGRIKVNLLFFLILNSLVMSIGYGQSTPTPPPPQVKSKTQEITSVMQESHVIKALKAQKSTASVATCDYDGDDSHCPPITPEKHQFFIRTGTQMSCANSGAATFLKNSKLSHLNVEARDIIDKRSRAPSLFNKNRSRESLEKFSGAARVKVSLVAWTTVESDHRYAAPSLFMNPAHFTQHTIYSHPSNGFRLSGEDQIVIESLRSTSFYSGIIGKVRRKARDGTHRTRIAIEVPWWWQIPHFGFFVKKAVQSAFVDHFKTRQAHYENLDEENLKNPNRKDNILSQHNTAGVAVLPPLSVQMHTLAYDDEVMANAGDALLKCVNEGTKENPVFFDADLDADKKVCLSDSQWMEKKSQSTPDKLAIHNKKLLYTYFKQVYGNNHSKYRPWQGSIFEGTRPLSNYYHETTPYLVFSTHFAVQSCQSYAQNTENNINQKNAHQVINEINKEINKVHQIIRSGEKLTKENTILYRLFEKYKPRRLVGSSNSADAGLSSGFNGTKAVLSSPFYWTIRVFEGVRERYKKAISMIEAGTTFAEIINIYQDLTFHSKYIGYRGKSEGDGLLHQNFGGFLSGAISCYHARMLLTHNINWVYYYDLNPDAPFSGRSDSGVTRWFNSSEYEIMDRNLVGYSPKWWEHTDLGNVCKLLSKGLKLKRLGSFKSLYQDFVELPRYLRKKKPEAKKDPEKNEPQKNEPLVLELEKIEKIGPLLWEGRVTIPAEKPPQQKHPEQERIEIEVLELPRESADLVKKNIAELDKIIELLKVTVGLEILEAKYQHYGPKNKACSPDTATYKVKENKTPPDPHWHKVYSSAVLDMRQNFDDPTSKPFKIFSSQHPSEGFSTDGIKQRLMTKDPLYLTFYSSNPDLEEDYHPGLPMIMVPGTDYIAPEVVADESSAPRRGYSGKYGISVYSYPPAACNLATTEHRGIKRPHRIWN